MIWLVGDPNDLSGAYLAWLARRRSVEVLELAEDRLGLDWSFELREDLSPVRTPGVRVAVGGNEVDLRDVSGAVVRLNPDPKPPVTLEAITEEQLTAVLAPERRSGLQHLLDAVSFPVANRPSCGRSNAAKPSHMRRLAAAGFALPEWIVSNDVTRASSFVSSLPCGAIVKATSGLRSHVRRWTPETAAAFAAGTAPHVIQRYVPGSDVRVHVVGDAVFSTRIHTDATDYRFDEPDTRYESCNVPAEIAALSVAHARDEGLLIAGLDFRTDDDGRWWCLEMNPVPTFLPYEAGAGQPIGDALIDILAPGTTSPDEISPLAAVIAPAVATADDERAARKEISVAKAAS
jgi:glutathione synthase/RimK-type ligase-like ATP-grasp enzyme